MRDAQAEARVRLDWGWGGATRAAGRGDILVVVDTLSFSTAVATAVQHGGIVYPCRTWAEAEEAGRQFGAEVAVSRPDVPAKGRFSLSPRTFVAIEAGARVILASPNGATCSRLGASAPYLFIGTLINAQAVAAAVDTLLQAGSLAVTVLAAGERHEPPDADGSLRFAVEDYLGAGAILAHLTQPRSAEAEVCAAAFRAVQPRLAATLAACASAQELIAYGYAADVDHAAQLNRYAAVPILGDGWFTHFPLASTSREG